MNYSVFIKNSKLVDEVDSVITTGDVEYNGNAIEIYDKDEKELFHVVTDEEGKPQVLFFAMKDNYRMPIELLERIIKEAKNAVKIVNVQ